MELVEIAGKNGTVTLVCGHCSGRSFSIQFRKSKSALFCEVYSGSEREPDTLVAVCTCGNEITITNSGSAKQFDASMRYMEERLRRARTPEYHGPDEHSQTDHIWYPTYEPGWPPQSSEDM